MIARLTSGRITVFSQSGGQLIIDLVGWFTGPSTSPSDVGLFVPVTPSRLLDSRELPLGARPGHNRTAQVPVAGRFGLPATGIGAVVVNATATDTAGIGFFTVWPAQTYRPTTSSLNATHTGQTIANHVITPVSTGGFSFYTQTGSHLVVDIAGWYTGTEIPTVLPPSVPLTGVGGPPPTPPFAFSARAQRCTNSMEPMRAHPLSGEHGWLQRQLPSRHRRGGRAARSSNRPAAHTGRRHDVHADEHQPVAADISGRRGRHRLRRRTADRPGPRLDRRPRLHPVLHVDSQSIGGDRRRAPSAAIRRGAASASVRC